MQKNRRPGTEPYGFRMVDNALVRHEGEQLILDLVQDHARRGMTMEQSAYALNREGYRNRRGGLFTKGSIQQKLRDSCPDIERLHLVMVMDREDAECLRERSETSGTSLNVYVRDILEGQVRIWRREEPEA